MTTRRNVQPLSNLNQRLAQYHVERQKWLRESVITMAVCIAVTMGMTWLAMQFAEQPIEYWQVEAVILGIFIAGLPIKMDMPARPTQADVEQDQALRRMAGMDDTVSPD